MVSVVLISFLPVSLSAVVLSSEHTIVVHPDGVMEVSEEDWIDSGFHRWETDPWFRLKIRLTITIVCLIAFLILMALIWIQFIQKRRAKKKLFAQNCFSAAISRSNLKVDYGYSQIPTLQNANEKQENKTIGNKVK